MVFTHFVNSQMEFAAILPRLAQEIYIAAFNNAWSEYRHDEERATKLPGQR
jgi:cation transport regulator ChaB